MRCDGMRYEKRYVVEVGMNSEKEGEESLMNENEMMN